MATKFPCTAVDMTFFEKAPFVYQAQQWVNATVEAVFSSFENAEDWPRWAFPIQKVEWTAPQPFGIGTTRTVFMVGGLTGFEEFIAWERGREMAFCFTHASKNNVESFAERYTVERCEKGGCTVTWTMAMRPRGKASSYFLPLFSPVMHFGVKHMLRRFKRLVEGRCLGF